MTTPFPPRGALRLTDWGVISARGADAASFLHGQLTQDMLAIGDTQLRLAGYCSAKGRLLASFLVWRQDAECIYLACSADLLAPTLKRLSMFVLRAKCKLSDVSAEFEVTGLVGATTQDLGGGPMPSSPWAVARGRAGSLLRLPDAEGLTRSLLLQPLSDAVPALPPLPPLDAQSWRWLEARSGVVRVVAATAEQFVPQMVNLELVGGVNFQKGCYPGQEIVARSQYRGTIKRRTLLFDCDADLAPGQEVFHSADAEQPAGMVANAGRRAGGSCAALVEVKLSALAGGTLHAGSAQGALLRPVALPYALPVEP